ncbi:transcriptional regulator, LysR family [Desulfocucumis palustris]|uniref:Transcriptional regulator, LysR family n=1 Tax=Desulfocucumis palustris TaxID=1898651 RepID=A0A2L2XA65_9FIRM|nr:LysR family transcriptional regulator [Desulfocucumis palustris]GBF32523.1 transcriptional regulator, LysR family [Desulfocucumis palustris]
MNIHYLRYFISVAENLNFSKAASKLYIAQPGLSQGIANLEKQIGVKLFERDRRSVQLTEAGAIFLDDAIEIVKKYDEAVDKVHQVSTSSHLFLTIGFLPSLGKVLLPQWIYAFSKEYPTITLSVKQFTMGTLHLALEDGSVDIGYTRSFGLKSTSGYMFKKVSNDSISVIIRSDHLLANHSKIDLKALAKESFVMVPQEESPQWHKFAMQIFSNRGIAPTRIITPGRVDGIFPLVLAKQGIGLVPSSNRTSDYPEIRFIDIDGDDVRFESGLAWKTSNSNPTILMFIEKVTSYPNVKYKLTSEI